MSDYCTFCGVVSRAACSTYKRKYLAAELRSCRNLRDSQRAGALYSAGFDEEAAAMQRVEELESEVERLRAAIARAEKEAAR